MHAKWMTPCFLAAVVSGLAGLAGCGKHGPDRYPLVKPPVVAATPSGFKSASLAASTVRSAALAGGGLSASEFKARFFSTGPTDIFGILDGIDSRIGDINSQASGDKRSAACLSQTPVAYSITPWGQSVTMYAQCYESVTVPGPSTGASFVQWGQKDGVTYLYTAIGAEHVAVIATPIAGVADHYKVQAWIGLGYSNSGCGPGTWDGCSYGVMQLVADASAGEFEFTVAGVGFGYAGAQLKSNGATVYAAASTDMGTTCGAVDSLCVAASDLTTPGTCADGTALTTFDLPAIGREAVAGSDVPPINGGTFAASQYPASGANVTLNGTASDALAFGPAAPTAGVGSF
jgi:hypothetical protein